MLIETEKYLNNALSFNAQERELHDLLLAQLPQLIVDIHTHTGRQQDVVNLHQELLLSKASTYPYFDKQNHLETRQALWGEKQIRQVVFGFPLNGVDIASANLHIREVCNGDSSFIPFLLGNPNDVEYTSGEIKQGFWKGLKVYPWQLMPPAKKIVDFLPEAILRLVADTHMAIMLHLPNGLTQDLPELTQIAQRFSRAKFMVAHFGFLRKDDPETIVSLKAIKNYNNIILDTSVYDDEAVFTSAFRILGPEKIVYGSDQPFNLIRGETVFHPILGKRTMTDNLDYHWVDKEEQLQYRHDLGINPAELPNMHFSSLNALLTAIEITFIQKAEQNLVKEMIFNKNAAVLLGI